MVAVTASPGEKPKRWRSHDGISPASKYSGLCGEVPGRCIYHGGDSDQRPID